MIMKIVKIKIDDVKPYENNVKLHPQEQIEQIKKSILDFGNNDPIAVDENNVIIEGHGRFMALQQLGYKEVECIILTNLNEDQKNAYRLVHNKLTMNSDFDLRGLEEELNKIQIDMSPFEFDMKEIEKQISILNDNERDLEEDDIPEPPSNPFSKIGNIWQLGRHRLMCGDSTKEEDVAKLMNGNKADMVFTDPPYGMNLDTDYSGMKSEIFKGGIGGKKYEQGIVDEFNPQMISIIMKLDVKETFIWGADYFAEHIPSKNEGSWVVWDKRANNNDDVEEDYSSDKMYGSCFELCWSRTKHKRDIARVKWAGIFGMSGQDQNKRFHPTQKPLELCSWFVNRYSKDNDVILDLYGGSGSTLIACEQLNRSCYMMELDPRFVDVIIERWEKLTGRKAVKL